MNRLQLTQRLSREANVNQTGPTSTLNQVGEYLRLVNWIDAAYEEIQVAHATWNFLRYEFSFALTIGVANYTATAAGLTSFSEWVADDEGESEDFRIYTTASDEQYMTYVPWDMFRVNYMVGTQRTQTGKPSIYTIKPDGSLLFFPIPDFAYTVLGEYYKAPQVMSADADVPIFDEKFHLTIMWKALMFYGAYASEADKYTFGNQQFKKLMRAMENRYLPQTSWGNPLA